MKILTVAVMVMMSAVCLTAQEVKKTAPAEKPAAVVAPARQTVCPVMGGKVNREIFVDVAGKRIYLCCAGCADPIRKDPQKYLQKMADAGVVPELAPVKPASAR